MIRTNARRQTLESRIAMLEKLLNESFETSLSEDKLAKISTDVSSSVEDAAASCGVAARACTAAVKVLVKDKVYSEEMEQIASSLENAAAALAAIKSSTLKEVKAALKQLDKAESV